MIKKTILRIVLPVLLAATFAFGAPLPKLQGDFQVHPEVGHPGAISGKISLVYDGVAITQVSLALDHPVYGRSSLVSSEQWVAPVVVVAPGQSVYAYKLIGPPHPWYFVLVGASSDGGVTVQGTIYRADSTLADIQKIALAPIVGVPANWKAVGSATMKAI